MRYRTVKSAAPVTVAGTKTKFWAVSASWFAVTLASVSTELLFPANPMRDRLSVDVIGCGAGEVDGNTCVDIKEVLGAS